MITTIIQECLKMLSRVGGLFRLYNLKVTSALGYTIVAPMYHQGGQKSVAYPTGYGNVKHLGHQSGAVLIISLIMLLLLTIIGTVGMQNASLEEKMAGNKRDYNLAFQAAESALRAAEASTAKIKSTDYYTGSKDPIDWTNAKVKTYGEGAAPAGTTGGVELKGLYEAPKYIIEKPTETEVDCSPCEIGPNSGKVTLWYRITARGTGGTANAVVTLQSIYKH
ncbi:MAG: PilX N-terminal domain-containing pilus assembly protein [Methyloglobulus sp.]